jgi:hypothetical protein
MLRESAADIMAAWPGLRVDTRTLLWRARSSDLGLMPALNIVYRCHGVASPAGRLADRWLIANRLADEVEDAGWVGLDLPYMVGSTPDTSEAFASRELALYDAELRRVTPIRRIIPMPEHVGECLYS